MLSLGLILLIQKQMYQKSYQVRKEERQTVTFDKLIVYLRWFRIQQVRYNFIRNKQPGCNVEKSHWKVSNKNVCDSTATDDA